MTQRLTEAQLLEQALMLWRRALYSRPPRTRDTRVYLFIEFEHIQCVNRHLFGDPE